MVEQLKQHEMEARLAEETFYRKQLPGMSALLGLEPISCDAKTRQLVVCHEVGTWTENVNGTAHGGIIAAVLDSAMGILCRCYTYPQRSVTTSLNISYLRPVKAGDKIYVRTELLRQGKSLSWLRAVAWTNDPEEPCASAEGTLYKIMPKA